jgi:hypothetical protein
MRRSFICALIALLAWPLTSWAQSSPPGVVLNLTAQAAGTVTSDDQQNLAPSPASLTCVFTQTSHTASPSTAFKIQARDEGDSTPTYYDIISSPAVTDDLVATPLYLGPFLADVTNKVSALPVPALWRVSATVTGGGATVTATVHCRIQ